MYIKDKASLESRESERPCVFFFTLLSSMSACQHCMCLEDVTEIYQVCDLLSKKGHVQGISRALALAQRKVFLGHLCSHGERGGDNMWQEIWTCECYFLGRRVLVVSGLPDCRVGLWHIFFDVFPWTTTSQKALFLSL